MTYSITKCLVILAKMDVLEGEKLLREEGAIAMHGEPVTADVVQAAMHKARIQLEGHFTVFQIQSSKRWLMKHGYEIPKERIQ